MKNCKVTLYIATHNKTGLKYFGKTTAYFTQEDLCKYYHGSGAYWKDHLRVHGNDVTMEIYGIYNLDEVEEIALKFSEENSIVIALNESGDRKGKKVWANEKPENGKDGGDNSKFIDYEKVHKKGKITKGKPEWKEKMKPVYEEIQYKNKKKMNSKEWKETTGKESKDKYSKWCSIEGNLQKMGESISKTKNSKEWKETTGKEAIEKQKKTKNSKEWKETTGKESTEKWKKTFNINKHNFKNYQVQEIHIFNEDNNLVYISIGSFTKFCKLNGLPLGTLKNSYRKNGEPIFKKNKSRKLSGWYALIKENYDN